MFEEARGYNIKDNLNINVDIIVICNQYWSHTEQIKTQSNVGTNTWFDLYVIPAKCLSKQQFIPGSVNFNFYICQMAYARKLKSFSYYNRHTFYQPIITIIVIPSILCSSRLNFTNSFPLWMRIQINPELKCLYMN